MKRVRFNLSTTFSTSLDIGKAVEYLNSGEIPLREATEIALSSFYRPLAAAREEASLGQVKALIEISRTQFETYMSLAISRCQKQLELDEEKDDRKIKNSIAEGGQKPAPHHTFPSAGFPHGVAAPFQDGKQLICDGESPEIEGIRFEDEEL